LANHKSALKRAKQNVERRLRNKSVKTKLRNIVKDVRIAVSEDQTEAVQVKLKSAKSVIDRAAKKGVIHKKTAARKISRLQRLANTTAG
jgi:small subunit ribosomal protein S20